VSRSLVLFAPLVLGCGSWKRVGGPDAPTGTEQMPQVFDPTAVFRQMGLIADAGPLSVVGSVRLLAGPPPDTTLVLVALSLHNRGLTFRRERNEFVADYRADLQFLRGTEIVQQVARDERIRVSNFRETLRTEESVIFQQIVPVRAGDYVLSITVRDRNGPNVSRNQVTLSVPGLVAPAVSGPIAVYEAAPRTSLSALPTLVANPRNAVAYGSDSLRFYVESYGMPTGSALAISVTDPAGRPVFADTVRLDTMRAVDARILAIAPAQLSIGRHELRIGVVGGGVVASGSFLVAFSDLWAVANFDDMLNLLRYFAPADTLRRIANAPPEERAAAWQSFWRTTDPNPVTPENEALDLYFARIQVANQRFRDEGTPGWLTDRGEVFIALGEPDEILDPRPDIQGRGRIIYWVYTQYRLQLVFIDDAGFGRFRLDPRSRSEYLVVLNRLRRQ
jgi:GWxTD domain-containing protein